MVYVPSFFVIRHRYLAMIRLCVGERCPMRLFCFLLLLCPYYALSASSLPVWELGIGAGIYSSPHYLGADQRSTYALPLPLFIYRGEYLKADRSGLIGQLYRNERLDLRLSASGALPVSSNDNEAREGMPDLDLMLEVGPVLEYRLWHTDTMLLRADLPLRAAVTLDGSGMEYRGLVSNPRLYYRAMVAEDLLLTATIGPMLADGKFHDYFYRVKAKYIRPGRPAYDADAGYTAMRYSVSLSRYWGDVFVGAFIHAYDLHGTANEDSPLVRQKDYVSTGLALGWMFRQSRRSVRQE